MRRPLVIFARPGRRVSANGLKWKSKACMIRGCGLGPRGFLILEGWIVISMQGWPHQAVRCRWSGNTAGLSINGSNQAPAGKVGSFLKRFRTCVGFKSYIHAFSTLIAAGEPVTFQDLGCFPAEFVLSSFIGHPRDI